MTRRALFTSFFAPTALALDHFGPNNPASPYPRCPACGKPAPANQPELIPVVATVAGDIATLPAAREITCEACGNVWRVRA